MSLTGLDQPRRDLHPVSRPKAGSQGYIRSIAVSLKGRAQVILGFESKSWSSHSLCPPDIPFRRAPPTSVSDISIKPSSAHPVETDQIIQVSTSLWTQHLTLKGLVDNPFPCCFRDRRRKPQSGSLRWQPGPIYQCILCTRIGVECLRNTASHALKAKPCQQRQ